MRTFILSIAPLLVFTGLAQAAVHLPEDLWGFVKAEIYFQTDTNTVTLETFDEFGHSPYEFDVFYEESSGETVTAITILTNQGQTSLVRASDGVWELPEIVPHHFASKALLDAAYPNMGSYLIFIDTSLLNNPFSTMFSFGSADNYFEAPQLSNTGFIDGVLKFDFTQNFTFNWNTPTDFVNGTDRLFLFIEEPVLNGNFIDIVDVETSQFTASHTLSGGTLDPLKTYDLELIFGKVVGDINLTVPGHAGVAAFGTVTSVELMHEPEPGTYGLIFGLATLGFVVLRRRRF